MEKSIKNSEFIVYIVISTGVRSPAVLSEKILKCIRPQKRQKERKDDR